MSVAKRSQKRQADVQSALPPPASKRIRATENSHVPKQTGLDFLVNENARRDRKIDAKLTNGTPKNKSTRVDESQAFVAPNTADDGDDGGDVKQADEVIGISSDEEEDSSDDTSSIDSEEALQYLAQKKLMNGRASESSRPQGEDAVLGAAAQLHEQVNGYAAHDETDEDAERPTFGDLLQAHHPEPIDVQRSLALGEAHDLVPSSHALGATSATSLGTVLTQALKTNDTDLLESCFRVSDLESIRATIERLRSQHAATLLQRIAERIHRRPGRAGNLMVWIQWSLVAHGGYLATQPDLMKQLSSLARVIKERASGLQPLLHLKGKLDMLSAQLEIRRKMQAASRAYNADDLDDEDGVLYIEGQTRDWSDEDDEMAMNAPSVGKLGSSAKRRLKQLQREQQDEEDSSSDEDDGNTDLPNGVGADHDHEDSSDAEDDEDENELLDVEAEEGSSNEDEDGSDVDDEDSDASSEDEEDEEDEDEDEEESEGKNVKPARLNTLNRKR